MLICALIFFSLILSAYSSTKTAANAEMNGAQTVAENDTIAIKFAGTTIKEEKKNEKASNEKSEQNASNVETEKTAKKRRLKILVYSPTLGWSHMQFMGQLADTLADAGHEVHFLRFLMNEQFAGTVETQKAQKIYSLMPSEEILARLDVKQLAGVGDPFGTGFPKFLYPADIFRGFLKIVTAICGELVKNTALLEQLQAEHFDVAISEIYDLCPFAIFHRIGVHTKLSAMACPLVQTAARQFGIPTFSSYVTNMIAPAQSVPSMGFFDRAINFINDVYEYYISDESTVSEELIIKQAFGDDFPQLWQIARNISLLFVNSNPFFEMPRPISNKIISIGGLVNMESTASLDEETNALMNGAEAGAVLVSFGSLADTKRMSSHVVVSLLRAFAQFPDYQFIWKFEVRDPQTAQVFASLAPNVRHVEWVDQRALLMHPKMRAFVSHCGQNSINEAARAGIPVLAIPLFADQLYNAILARLKGMAVHVDVLELHKEEADNLIASGLEKILHDPQYRQNAQTVAKKYTLTPFSARERLVHWVEFAAEFPELNELNLPLSQELSLLVYYSLDVILALLVIASLATTGFLLLSRAICRRIWHKIGTLRSRINSVGKVDGSRNGMTRRILQKSVKMKRI